MDSKHGDAIEMTNIVVAKNGVTVSKDGTQEKIGHWRYRSLEAPCSSLLQ